MAPSMCGCLACFTRQLHKFRHCPLTKSGETPIFPAAKRLSWKNVTGRPKFTASEVQTTGCNSCNAQEFRILVLRQKTQPTKGPLQLDLFEPKSHLYEYQAIVTWKDSGPRAVMDFHHGRGSQRHLCRGEEPLPDGIYPSAGFMRQPIVLLVGRTRSQSDAGITDAVGKSSASNHSQTSQPVGFETLGTLRQRLIHRAGRLIRPQGWLTLVLSGSDRVRQDMARSLSP